ncbi:MAG: peroxide stress protein YaaA [Oscillospiraceae bacterium]|nr:peroxide stress protein YaaA [Oscillospiraceae bacterium]
MLKIIISPAKKMVTDPDSLECTGLPYFVDKAEYLKNILKSKNYAELKKLWACNDSIAELNCRRLDTMDLHRNITPAILAYDGIAFKYMAPAVFDNDQFEYIQNHLFILSGFYGAVRPFDGVVPYRLEMQAKLKTDDFKNLYDYWGNKIYDYVTTGCDVVINLASEEYSKVISKYITDKVKFVTVTFADLINGRLVEKGTKCKMARGEMVRYMAENHVEDADEIKYFNRLDYTYSPEHSTDTNIVFIYNKAVE